MHRRSCLLVTRLSPAGNFVGAQQPAINPYPKPDSSSRGSVQVPGPLFHFATIYIFRVSHPPKRQAVGPPHVVYPRLLIQYIRRYSSYMDDVCSIRHLWIRHVVVHLSSWGDYNNLSLTAKFDVQVTVHRDKLMFRWPCIVINWRSGDRASW